MSSALREIIPPTFTPVPSYQPETVVDFTAVTSFSDNCDAIGIFVAAGSEPDQALGLSSDSLALAGFEGKEGQTLLIPSASGTPLLYAIGVGARESLTADSFRAAAATLSRATAKFAHVGVHVSETHSLDSELLGQVLAEGFLLGRYRYNELKSESTMVPLATVEIMTASSSGVTAGIARGVIAARGAMIARDLANTPPGHLTATDFADVALRLKDDFGLEVTIADKKKLVELGCGGILGVNAGSAEEPRMITLRYTPETGTPTGHIAMIGKGIMYDSGGISLKPSDPMHLLMKMDMGGAAAIFGALTTLRDRGCTNTVTAFLMCTDNMPSGSAYKLGDVLTARGGKTVEVKNTDAEGRLVMMDGLALAAEQKPDVIVDIATLTGAALMALGPECAALLGNNQGVLDQLAAASAATDEKVWQLPLEKKYRKLLDSDIADIANLGGQFAGATTAALFLNEFVAGIPWGHIDIAGTMQSAEDDGWRSKGATGFGARLLSEFALGFRV